MHIHVANKSPYGGPPPVVDPEVSIETPFELVYSKQKYLG